MICEPIEIQDKLGRTVILRTPTPDDADALIQYLKVTSAETPYLIREPEEITLTHEQEVTFINSSITSERSAMLIATIDGKHIGNCSLQSLGNFKRYAHRCEIAIALYQEYCECGIGKQMLETILKITKEIGYEQAELEVISSNTSAIALYKKLGFKKYGTFPNNMKYVDGTYESADWMMKKLWF